MEKLHTLLEIKTTSEYYFTQQANSENALNILSPEIILL